MAGKPSLTRETDRRCDASPVAESSNSELAFPRDLFCVRFANCGYARRGRNPRAVRVPRRAPRERRDAPRRRQGDVYLLQTRARVGTRGRAHLRSFTDRNLSLLAPFATELSTENGIFRVTLRLEGRSVSGDQFRAASGRATVFRRAARFPVYYYRRATAT